MNKTTLNSQEEKYSMLSLRRATSVALPGLRLHLDFYPRSPCGERQLILPVKFTAWAFLSTLSLRRATGNDRRGCWYSCYFYPRSPYGERRMSRCTVAGSCRFLSTLSLRRATNAVSHRPRRQAADRADRPQRFHHPPIAGSGLFYRQRAFYS